MKLIFKKQLLNHQIQVSAQIFQDHHDTRGDITGKEYPASQ